MPEPLCVCRHESHLHNGPWYSTGLGTVSRGCDECPCAYYAPVADLHGYDGSSDG